MSMEELLAKIEQVREWHKEFSGVISYGHFERCAKYDHSGYNCQENGSVCYERLSRILEK